MIKQMKKTTKAGQSMIRGALEALDYASNLKDHKCVAHVPEKIDVKAIREQTRMSQEQFSKTYGFNKRTLQQWEQGNRLPTGASRAFLTVITREPKAVQRALLKTSISH